MFRFNFNSDDATEENLSGAETQECDESRNSDNIGNIIQVFPENVETLEEEILHTPLKYTYKECHIHYVDDTKVVEWLKRERTETGRSCKVLEVLDQNMDVSPGVYEGGFKVWECASDLIQYLHSQELEWKGKKILELGCGAALPGLFAFLHGATVHFQDYNEEVIKYITVPNVLLNKKFADVNSVNGTSCRFFSGDWSALLQFFKDAKETEDYKYDYILASEVIYNINYYRKLANLIKYALKEDGVLFLAAKTYYFGVGGGTREFEEVLQKSGGLQTEVCHVTMEGVQREILKIIRKT